MACLAGCAGEFELEKQGAAKSGRFLGRGRMIRRVISILGVCSAAAAFCASASADTIFSDLESPQGYTVTLGAEGRVTPKYEGSNNYEFMPLPLFDVRPVGTPARFHSPREGFGVSVYEIGKFSAGPVVHFEFGRRAKTNPNLLGLDDVKWVIEAGGFAEYWVIEWLRARVEVRKGFHGHHGVIADQMLDVVVPVRPALTLSGGPRMRISDSSGNSKYFDISPDQSVASGLPAYHTNGGIRSVGVGSQVIYQWDPHWATHAFAEYDRLVSDAADSPLVTLRGSRNQATLGAGFAYSFDVLK
jgi:outer membrane protein